MQNIIKIENFLTNITNTKTLKKIEWRRKTMIKIERFNKKSNQR